MGRLKIYLLVVVLCSVQIVQGQENIQNPFSTIEEQLFLDSNTNILLAGEELLYSVFITENPTQYQSKIAYTALIDKTSKTWMRQKIVIDSNGRGSGSFMIPTEAVTGNYKLIAYTKWSKLNKNEAYHIQDLVIINPFVPPVQKDNTGDSIIISTQLPEINLNAKEREDFTIKMDKPSYQKRQKITLNLNAVSKNHYGNYTVSVREVPSISSNQELPSSFLSPETDASDLLPEIKGELITGKLQLSNSKQNLENQLVSLSIPGKEYIFKLSKTQSNGDFSFLIDNTYDTDNAVIQLLDANNTPYKLNIQESDFNSFKELDFKEVYLDPDIESWLTKQNTDVQIENAYKETQPVALEDSLLKEAFYDPLQVRYTLDAYTRFPTMHETFIEVVELAAMRINSEDVRLRVYNRDIEVNNEENKLDPLVLIDGILIQDYSLVANLNPNLVEFIDVVPEQYRYGPKLFGGIIAIMTKEKDFSLPESFENVKRFSLLLPTKDSGYTPLNYNSTKNLERIPDYRTQLYWNSSIKLAEEPVQLDFFTSDKEGLFEVKCTGYTKSGEKLIFTKRFQVETVQ